MPSTPPAPCFPPPPPLQVTSLTRECDTLRAALSGVEAKLQELQRKDADVRGRGGGGGGGGKRVQHELRGTLHVKWLATVSLFAMEAALLLMRSTPPLHLSVFAAPLD